VRHSAPSVRLSHHRTSACFPASAPPSALALPLPPYSFLHHLDPPTPISISHYRFNGSSNPPFSNGEWVHALVHLAPPFSWPMRRLFHVTDERYIRKLVKIGHMVHRHSIERLNHVIRSGCPGIVSISVVFYPVMSLLILLFLFTQEGNQNCRSVIFLYLVKLKSIEQRTSCCCRWLGQTRCLQPS
jgi:hypothetical protein